MPERKYNPIIEDWRITPNPNGKIWKNNPNYKPDAFEITFGVKP